VELQAVGALAEAEGLVLAGFAAREVDRARRHVEGVRMPLEDLLAAVEMAEQPVFSRCRPGVQRVPADFAHPVRAHARAERRGEELRA